MYSMKAILLAGGVGTRLRPLTLNTPKPIVPIFDRPFLFHQIDLLKTIPEIDEIILSLNYQPTEIKSLIGNGETVGLPIRYMVEPKPLGTGGAIKYATDGTNETVLVFNGDVLTQLDLGAVLELHKTCGALATIVLTPVDNPTQYGLVETDQTGHVRRFLEKPTADEVTCNTINAGIYVLEPSTFGRIPFSTKYSIERSYFPSLIEHKETFVAYIQDGYWLDIGTPAHYLRAHRDIMTGRYIAQPFLDDSVGQVVVDPTASVDTGAVLENPCFIGASARIEAGARIGANSVISRGVAVRENATIDGAIILPGTTIGRSVMVRHSIVGQDSIIDSHAMVGPNVVLGDKSVLTPYTRTGNGFSLTSKS